MFDSDNNFHNKSLGDVWDKSNGNDKARLLDLQNVGGHGQFGMSQHKMHDHKEASIDFKYDDDHTGANAFDTNKNFGGKFDKSYGNGCANGRWRYHDGDNTWHRISDCYFDRVCGPFACKW